MILPYFVRLLCVSLASFFLVQLSVGLIVSLIAPASIRMAGRMRPRSAARLLLAMRLLPLGLAGFAVAGLCVPSYLWLEPEAAIERVGFTCLAAALLGVASWGISITRGLRAATRSLRFIQQCECAGRKTSFVGESSPVWVIEGAGRLVALAGIIRPRLIVSRDVVNALSAEQLAAALQHERAHRASSDNLKRLLVLLAPGILPFSRQFEALERGWVEFSEWAADDLVGAGDSRRSLSLAEALVRVARMRAAPQLSPLMTSLLADHSDLSARVGRLLGAVPPGENAGRCTPVLLVSAALLLSGSLAVAMLQPATLSSVHELLEHLIR